MPPCCFARATLLQGFFLQFPLWMFLLTISASCPCGITTTVASMPSNLASVVFLALSDTSTIPHLCETPGPATISASCPSRQISTGFWGLSSGLPFLFGFLPPRDGRFCLGSPPNAPLFCFGPGAFGSHPLPGKTSHALLPATSFWGSSSSDRPAPLAYVDTSRWAYPLRASGSVGPCLPCASLVCAPPP